MKVKKDEIIVFVFLQQLSESIKKIKAFDIMFISSEWINNGCLIHSEEKSK